MEITLTFGELVTYGGGIITIVLGYAELKYRGIQNTKDINDLKSSVKEIVSGNQDLESRTVMRWRDK